MKFDLRTVAAAALAAGAVLTAETIAVAPAHAQNGSYYMWCVLNDYRGDTAYYSGVFTSTNEMSYSHDVPFANFVESRYGVSGAHAQCYTDDTQANAQNAKSSDMSRGVFRSVVDTGWRP